MATETKDPIATNVLEHNRAAQDAISVGRVFGRAYEVDGKTIIPVAAVRGGGGGGGGVGEADGSDTPDTFDDEGDETAKSGSGSGFGSGFGLGARPVGVYEVTEQGVDWKPTIDVTRLARNGQVLAGLIVACLTLILWKRQQ